MPDVRKCSIYGCRSNSRDHRDLKFFNFPPSENPLYNTWISVCHESADVLAVIRRPYICSIHFYPWHVGFRRLAVGAIPALNLQAPPGFAEEERARVEEEEAALKEKERVLRLINDSVLIWAKRAQFHPEFGSILCTARRELQQVGREIRNLIGATLTFSIDDYWLRKFRKSHLSDWKNIRGTQEQQTDMSLDLLEIIKSVDSDAKIFSEEEIAVLVEEEERIAKEKAQSKLPYKRPRQPFEHCPPLNYSESSHTFQPEKRSFQGALEEFYGIESKNDSHNQVKSEKIDSIDLSDSDCVDGYSEDSGMEVKAEPIVIETYQQALEHLKPLEDFVLRQENFRAIGLLSTLENIFKNPQRAT